MQNAFEQEIWQMKPAAWPWGRAIRAAACIGLPLAGGMMWGDIMTGMWVAMGCLMMATGEPSKSYQEVYRTIAISAPIGATGYLLGYLGVLPWTLVVLIMMLIGLIAGWLSSRNHVLSIGTLQTLLLASIALGVPAITPFWEPAFLYLLGALFYALVLAVEVLIRGWHAQDTPVETPVLADKAPMSAQETVTRPMIRAFALAACLGVAYSSRWFDHAAHWFWIPLTVGLVMKPDLGSVRDRSLQRIIGTVIGVAIGAAILTLVPKDYSFVLIMAALASVLPWAMQRSYILQAVFLTPLILMLVDVIVPGSGEVDFALQRLIDTVIGSVIVIFLGYLPLRNGRRNAGVTGV